MKWFWGRKQQQKKEIHQHPAASPELDGIPFAGKKGIASSTVRDQGSWWRMLTHILPPRSSSTRRCRTMSADVWYDIWFFSSRVKTHIPNVWQTNLFLSGEPEPLPCGRRENPDSAKTCPFPPPTEQAVNGCRRGDKCEPNPYRNGRWFSTIRSYGRNDDGNENWARKWTKWRLFSILRYPMFMLHADDDADGDPMLPRARPTLW